MIVLRPFRSDRRIATGADQCRSARPSVGHIPTKIVSVNHFCQAVLSALGFVAATILCHSLAIAQGSVSSQAPSNVAASSSPIKQTKSTTTSASFETRVEIPSQLESIYRRGGVPESLSDLRVLEQQQLRVAERGRKCTVSVRIGPSQGCGVIVTGTGFIVTAAHVAMRPGLDAIVTLADGRQVKATTLGMNRYVDAGLIRINPGQDGGRPWPKASLGTSDNLLPGMWCIAIGHPGGYDLTREAVIRVGRLLEVRQDVILTDCALIGGDSGGPLFDLAGNLIAVHSRIGNAVSENLHVPIDQYDYSWDRMAAEESWGHLPDFKPVLGVSGNKSTDRATIIRVRKGSPAESGGMRVGDVVVRFGEKQIKDFGELKAAVDQTMPGERVRIMVDRDGVIQVLFVEIGRTS